MNIFILFFSVLVSQLTSASEKDFYKELLSKALISNIHYYSLYIECLQDVRTTNQCTKDGGSRSSKYNNNVAISMQDLLEKYNKLYSTPLPPKPKELDINSARNNFIREATYFERKLLLFMASTHKKCGNPELYETLKEFGVWHTDYYLDGASTKEEFIFKQYEEALNDDFYKNKEKCKSYLNLNAKIYNEAFGNEIELTKRPLAKENLLVIFIDMFIIEIMESEAKGGGIKY